MSPGPSVPSDSGDEHVSRASVRDFIFSGNAPHCQKPYSFKNLSAALHSSRGNVLQLIRLNNEFVLSQPNVSSPIPCLMRFALNEMGVKVCSTAQRVLNQARWLEAFDADHRHFLHPTATTVACKRAGET